jgi:outer membrane protein OmpA-like peptidoglycan-associated protein
VGLGHESRAALLPAGDETNALAPRLQAIEDGQITLSGHAEAMGNALGNQAVNKKVPRKL